MTSHTTTERPTDLPCTPEQYDDMVSLGFRLDMELGGYWTRLEGGRTKFGADCTFKPKGGGPFAVTRRADTGAWFVIPWDSLYDLPSKPETIFFDNPITAYAWGRMLVASLQGKGGHE